jgi:hypothetical protein
MLMIVLAIIIIGLSIFLAVRMFDENAASANLDRMTSILVELGTRAQKYYRTPAFMNGGGSSFVGITADAQGLALLTNVPVSEDGSFNVLVAGTDADVTLQGVGVEDGDGDGVNCTATLRVSDDDMLMTILNR